MKALLPILALVATCHAQASTLSAGDASAALRGTHWIGTFTVLGRTNPIGAHFLNETDANGDLLYFHELPGRNFASRALRLVDSGCAYTPRKVHLEDTSTGVQGKISLFACAHSQEEEAALRETTARSPRAEIGVTSLELNEERTTLLITIRLSRKLTVRYDLHAVPE